MDDSELHAQRLFDQRESELSKLRAERDAAIERARRLEAALQANLDAKGVTLPAESDRVRFLSERVDHHQANAMQLADSMEAARAENAALREQLAARETVPVAVPVDVLEKLIERWGELRDKAWLKDTASNDEIGHAIDECVIDLRIAVDALKQRETVPALTREAAYQLVEDDIREARLNSDWPSFEFLTSSVRLSSFYAGVIRRSSLLEAVDALRKEDGHG